MIDVCAKQCAHPICTTAPTFKCAGKCKLYGSERKRAGMENVNSKRCAEYLHSSTKIHPCTLSQALKHGTAFHISETGWLAWGICVMESIKSGDVHLSNT